MISWLGAIEMGLVYGIVAIAVFLSFRVLNFPDLTIDGSFPLGAAAAASLIVRGVDPLAATAAAFAAGAVAGAFTAFLNLRFGILHLLASILTMTGLYSINLRVMGAPNVALLSEPSVLTLVTRFAIPQSYGKVLVAAIAAGVASALVTRWLVSEHGLGVRAVGANPRMALANGVSKSGAICLGLGVSNGLGAVAGALFAQLNGFADVTMGSGTIVVGLAAVILGEVLLRPRSITAAIFACIVGSVSYRVVMQIALNTDVMGLNPSDLNLLTAMLVVGILALPQLKTAAQREWSRGRARK